MDTGKSRHLTVKVYELHTHSKGSCKGKGHPRAGYKGPEGE